LGIFLEDNSRPFCTNGRGKKQGISAFLSQKVEHQFFVTPVFNNRHSRLF
jgi:hypothetical protein